LADNVLAKNWGERIMRVLASIFLCLACAFFQQSAFAANACSQQSTEEAETAAQSPCWQKALTTFEMGQCAAEDRKQADDELNKTYQQVLALHRGGPAALARINRAQRAWLAFRDAELDMLFAEEDRPHRGTMFSMCRVLRLVRLTEERTKALKQMLNPKEGDVCEYYPPSQ
jgi:uncharacterized protein YecT (DUF1311 family)